MNEFVGEVMEYIRENPTGMILVHCTHGFNRTGVWGLAQAPWGWLMLLTCQRGVGRWPVRLCSALWNMVLAA